MKKIFYLLAMIIANYAIEAQVKTPQPSPKSVLNQVVGLTDVTIDYSRQSTKGRTVFGSVTILKVESFEDVTTIAEVSFEGSCPNRSTVPKLIKPKTPVQSIRIVIHTISLSLKLNATDNPAAAQKY